VGNPLAWEMLFYEIGPMIETDTFSCFSDDDHVDDGYPALAWEWDVL